MKNLLKLLYIFIISLVIVGCKDNKPIVDNGNDKDKEPKEENYSLSVISFGDALIHPAVFIDAKRNSTTYNFKKMFTEIEKIIKDYDLKFYNQETVIGGNDLGPSGYPTFNSPEEIGNDLVEIGFNIVNLASNHTMDKGVKGATFSANFWENKKDVYAVGSYTSKEKRDEIVIKEKNGIKYTVLSYTYGTNGIQVPSGYEYLINVYSDEQAKIDIEKVRDKVDVVMVSMHWGVEYSLNPSETQQKQAEYLASLGVDVIIGHHPHVIQPITFIDKTLVIYSLGNMISNQRVLGVEKNIGLAVAFNIDKKVKDGETTISINEVKADLIWTKSTNPSLASSYDFSVIPFTQVTDSMLANHESVYNQYCQVVNKYNNDLVKVGFFE